MGRARFHTGSAATGLLPAMERRNAQGNGHGVVLAARWLPAARAQDDSVVLAGSVQIVCLQDAPFEAGLQLGQGLRLYGLVGLDRTKQSALGKLVPQMVHNSGHRRLRTTQIQAANQVESMAPGRRDEHNKQAAGRCAAPPADGAAFSRRLDSYLRVKFPSLGVPKPLE